MTDMKSIQAATRNSTAQDVDFDAFYERLFPRAVALAHALAGSRLAEDIAQDAFWVTYQRWDELESPERWLMRVITNRSRSALRRSYAEARALKRLFADRATTVVVPEPVADFWTAVKRLPHRQAQVIALLFVEELSTQEAAGVLECSEATVRVHLHRAKQRLAERFQAEV
ncbi:MAG: sigma-70 family RNA polymerase sigma factor [Actinobacteria bacterium]|nr:sigma-70 family RNA polymerase sigma factor [Actinomycetota bacterium]